MRRCLHILMLLSLGCASALAQEKFPSRAITLVCQFPPGGTADVILRVVAPPISEKIGMPVVVENRPGATGAISAAHVARKTGLAHGADGADAGAGDQPVGLKGVALQPREGFRPDHQRRNRAKPSVRASERPGP